MSNRKFCKLFLLAILFTAPFFAKANDVSRFVFVTNPQTIKPNEISKQITLQAQDSTGSSVLIPQTGCVKLESSSASGEFSSNNTNWSAVNILTMNKNTANKNFYYKDISVGNYILKAKIALRPIEETKTCASWPTEEWGTLWNAEQNIIVSENITTSTTTITTLEQIEQPAPPSGASWPVEPQVFANAGEDRNVIVGADVTFSGKALGLEKKPLDGARYLWNFGDGASKEGQNVLHAYKYPADYIVILDVSSGQYSASDRALIKVIPNQIKITEANANFIKLKNSSNVLIDVGGWFLKSARKTFSFPAKTLIAGGVELPLASDVTGLSGEGIIEMFYPNGSLSFKHEPLAQSTPGVDYQKISKPVIQNVSNVQKNVLQTQQEKVQEKLATQSTSTENITNNQSANIITVAQNNSWSMAKWLAIILGLGIFTGAGFFVVNRQNQIEKYQIDEIEEPL